MYIYTIYMYNIYIYVYYTYIHTLHLQLRLRLHYITLPYITMHTIHTLHTLHTYVRTHARTHARMHAHTDIHTYIHTCMHACIYYTFSPWTQYIQVDRVKESTTLGEGQKKSNVLRVALQAFQTYDATGDGSLNIEELRKALKAPGSSLSCWGLLDTPKIVWLVVNK